MYKIVFSKQVYKSLRRIPRDVIDRMRRRLDQIAEDPFAQYANVTKLQNRPGYRLRVGDWRVVYDVQEDKLVILVLKVGSRGDIYRGTYKLSKETEIRNGR